METDIFEFVVDADDRGEAGRGAQAFADALREAEGVLEATRRKADPDSMDLGTVVQVVVASGAMLALAKGIADWLRARRGVTLTLERSGKSGSLKMAVKGLDPATAERIIERELPAGPERRG